MRTVFEPITKVIAAGATFRLTGEIRFFLLASATTASALQVRYGNTSKGMTSAAALIEGVKSGPMVDIDVIEIVNTDAAPNTVTVWRGTVDFDYNRPVTLGVFTVADGGDAAQGAKADAAATADTGTFSLLALTKRILARLTTLFDKKGVRVRGATASMTGTAATDVIAAPAAGFHLVVRSIVAHCTSATVATEVAISDGATELFRLSLKAGTDTGSGQSISLPIPDGIQLSTATALRATNITTGSAVRVAAFGVVEAD